jgi:hypothetical protein
MSYDVALYDSSGAEITAAGYARQSTLPSNWTGGYNNVAITFGPAGAAWGTIASMKVWNGTTLIGGGPVQDILGDPVTVANGASLTFAIGTITLTTALTAIENVAF